jgi:hypothetical protein
LAIGVTSGTYCVWSDQQVMLNLFLFDFQKDGRVQGFFLDFFMLSGFLSLFGNDSILFFFNFSEDGDLFSHLISFICLLSLVVLSDSLNFLLSNLFEFLGTFASVSDFGLDLGFLNFSSLDLFFDDGGRLDQGCLDLVNRLLLNDLSLDFLLEELLFLGDSLTLDFSSSLFNDDLVLLIFLDGDFLSVLDLGLDLLKFFHFGLVANFYLTLNLFSVDLSNGLELVGFNFQLSGFFLHHSFLLGVSSLFGGSLKSFSDSVSSDSFLFFFLGLLFFDGFDLLSLDFLVLELLLFASLLFMGLTDLAGDTGVLFITLLLPDLLGLLGDGGALDKGYLGLCLGLDDRCSFKHNLG